MLNEKKRSFFRRSAGAFAAVILACVLIIGNAASAYAESPVVVGASSYPYDGPEANTFAQLMDLQQIFLVKEKFNCIDYNSIDPVSGSRLPQPVREKELAGPDPVLGSSNLAVTVDTRPDSHPKAVYLKAEAMPKTTDKKGSKTYSENDYVSYTYKDAAIFPDGSGGDVTIKYTLLKIDAFQDVEGADVAYGEPMIVTMFGTRLHANFGTYALYSYPSPDGKSRSFKAYIKTEIMVTGASADQTFLLPVHGVSAIRDTAGSYSGMRDSFPETTPDGAVKSTREHIDIPDDMVLYYSDQGEFDKSVGENTLFPTSVRAGDPDYRGGVVFEGKSGIGFEFGGIAGRTSNATFANNLWLSSMGDLQHRITSGSGTGGKIETDKKGDTTGTTLEGGGFPGRTFPEDTGSSDLRRYVVPDAKAGVTYTMAPEAGYAIDEVEVDGVRFLVPNDPASGTEWTDELPSKDGGGVLKHLGDGKYSYTFGNANTEDHTIYVIWKKGPTGEDKKTYGGKGETQKGTPRFEKGTGDIPEKGAYTLLDKDGNPVTSITVKGEGKYTIDPDTGEVTFEPEPDFVGEAKGVTVQVTDSKGMTATAKYTPVVVDNRQTVTKTQKISYYYDDGSPVLGDDGKPLVKTRTKTYVRSGKVDPETGEITWEDWTPADIEEVVSPPVKGYTPDIDVVPGGIYTPETWPDDVEVTYTKNADSEDPEDPEDPEDTEKQEAKKHKNGDVSTGDTVDILNWMILLVTAAFCLALARRYFNRTPQEIPHPLKVVG